MFYEKIERSKIKNENKKIICVILIGIIVKIISFYKYREALYLNSILPVLIYFFIIFGDVFLSRVKKFRAGNMFVLSSISFSVFIVMSKFHIDITYVSQCSMTAMCFLAILFNKENKKYKNIFSKIMYIFWGMIIFIIVLFGVGSLLSYKISTLSVNGEKVKEITFQEHIKELMEELK